MIIHPLRFARRPCLRGTVSYCLLLQNKMAPRNVMPSLFIAKGVYSSTVLQFVFSPPPLLAFRTDDEKKASHYHHNANERFGFNLFLLALISSFAKK